VIGTFVGREREVAQVGEGLAQVMGGRGGVFMLVGEPGIGKTRLADAIAHDARTRGLARSWSRSPKPVTSRSPRSPSSSWPR
jgi:chromosomal replication initiation ATPase DnaA